MRYASSIKYGGLLVAAPECNYEAYIKLGLVCPFCKESVFLTAGHERYYTKNQKNVSVTAHFSHRPDKEKSEVLKCELRSSKLSQFDINQSKTVSKNQRLKLFNRHLWNILMTCYKLNDFVLAKQLVERGFSTAAPCQAIADNIQQSFLDLLSQFISQQIEQIHNQSKYFVAQLIEKTKDDKLVTHKDLQLILATWRQSIDREMHLEIYNEVIDCITRKKHLPILHNLIILGLYNYVCVTAIAERSNLNFKERLKVYNSFHCQEVQIEQTIIASVFQRLIYGLLTANEEVMESVANFVRDDILEVVALTPWSKGFEEINGIVEKMSAIN